MPKRTTKKVTLKNSIGKKLQSIKEEPNPKKNPVQPSPPKTTSKTLPSKAKTNTPKKFLHDDEGEVDPKRENQRKSSTKMPKNKDDTEINNKREKSPSANPGVSTRRSVSKSLGKKQESSGNNKKGSALPAKDKRRASRSRSKKNKNLERSRSRSLEKEKKEKKASRTGEASSNVNQNSNAINTSMKNQMKSKSKSRPSSRLISNLKEKERDKEKSVSISDKDKSKGGSSLSPRSKSVDSHSRSIRSSGSESSKTIKYKEISTGFVPREFPTHGVRSAKKQIKANQPAPKPQAVKRIVPSPQSKQRGGVVKKIKEVTGVVESSSSIDLSSSQKKSGENYSSGPESQRITQEVAEVIKRIENKNKQNHANKLLDKKRSRGNTQDLVSGTKERLSTAKDFDYILQKNPNNKRMKSFINLENLALHPIITYSDMILALLEIGQNSNNYLLAYSSKSRCFWTDILQYKIMKKIFVDFKAETLRKYYKILSKYDPENTTDLIKKNKNYLDKLPIKLGTIVNSIAKLLDGEIKSLQEYIDEIKVDIRKREIFEHEFKDKDTGKITKVKEVRTTYNTYKSFEPGDKKEYLGTGFNSISLKEIYEKDEKNMYQNTLRKMEKEEKDKYSYLEGVNEEMKHKLGNINETDKFLFKAIDDVVDGISREFGQYSKEFIVEMLMQNSMDITRTYLCLKDPSKAKIIGFTPLDDKIILRMKDGEEYVNLVKEKGNESIKEREDYLTS